MLNRSKTVHNRAMTHLTSITSGDAARPALRVAGLTKRYAGVTALDDVSFTVARGEIVGLLGPNGAGKTTTINMILGVLEPSAGEVAIDSIDIAKRALARAHAGEFRRGVRIAPRQSDRQRELAILRAALLHRCAREPRRRVARGVRPRASARHACGLLSSGEQTRAALAKALINRPSLLLLDEPTASLDPSAAQIIRERIKRLASQERCGILWTSHNMREVQAVCDRVLFLSRGKVLLAGDPNTLPQEHGAATLEDLFIRVAREPLTLPEPDP